MTQFSRKKIIAQKSSTDLTSTNSRITNLENNEYKITYYEVISGASGSLTLPTGATINAGEFGLSGNCILSKIDGSNKPTFESPRTSGGTVVTASLNVSTGAWVASGTYTDSDVALIYSIKIKAIDYHNLDYDLIIETVDVGLAHLDSPIFIGIPEAPKALLFDATTQIATTEWVRDNAGGCLYRNTTGGTSVTGVTTQQLVDEHLIAANTMEAGYDLYNELNVNKNLDNGTVTLRVLYNSTNSLSGATTLATYTSNAANNQVSFERNFGVISASITELLTPPATSNAGDFIATSNTTVTQLNIDWTQPVYILWSIQNSSALDTTVISRNKLWKK